MLSRFLRCAPSDMDEVIQHVKPECKVFKVRNEGNFCFDSKKWLYSDKTGARI